MGGFWKAVGKGFAYVGKGALAAALWASTHPEVLALILSAAKLPPNVTQGIEAGIQVASAAEQPK